MREQLVCLQNAAFLVLGFAWRHAPHMQLAGCLHLLVPSPLSPSAAEPSACFNKPCSATCPAGDLGCFVPLAWLDGWANGGVEAAPDPVDNSQLLCPHNKLDPAKVPSEWVGHSVLPRQGRLQLVAAHGLCMPGPGAATVAGQRLLTPSPPCIKPHPAAPAALPLQPRAASARRPGRGCRRAAAAGRSCHPPTPAPSAWPPSWMPFLRRRTRRQAAAWAVELLSVIAMGWGTHPTGLRVQLCG